MSDFKDLLAFKKSMDLAMRIFDVSKRFPKEEIYSLTTQIRKSSRSVCANLSEAFRKRRYRAHFISKLTDCDAENSETQTWLLFALKCEYIHLPEFAAMNEQSLEVGRLLNDMLQHPDKYNFRN